MNSPYFPERSIFSCSFSLPPFRKRLLDAPVAGAAPLTTSMFVRSHFIGKSLFSHLSPPPNQLQVQLPWREHQSRPGIYFVWLHLLELVVHLGPDPLGRPNWYQDFCILGPFRTHIVKAEGHIPRSGHVSSRVTSICCCVISGQTSRLQLQLSLFSGRGKVLGIGAQSEPLSLFFFAPTWVRCVASGGGQLLPS